jgi:hypothetical protein
LKSQFQVPVATEFGGAESSAHTTSVSGKDEGGGAVEGRHGMSAKLARREVGPSVAVTVTE